MIVTHSNIEHKNFDKHVDFIGDFHKHIIESFKSAGKIFVKKFANEAKSGMVKYPAQIKKSADGRLYYTTPNLTNHLRILTGGITNALMSLGKHQNRRGAIYKYNKLGNGLKLTMGINVSANSYSGNNYALIHDRPDSRFRFFRPTFVSMRHELVEIQALELAKRFSKYGK